MLGRLVILAAIVIAILLVLDWFRRTPAEKVARILRRSALIGAIVLVLLLVATGRLHPLFAALSAAIPVLFRALNLLRMLPMVRQLMAQLGLSGAAPAAGGGGGQTSSIRTRFLDMTLEHASGALDGTVLEGPYRGRRLSELALEPLLELFSTCRGADQQSASVLEAYLDRRFGDAWREQVAGGPHSGATAGTGQMTREEAWEVLGLKPGAQDSDIIAAHRRLMQKLHPDRGGSTYLAAMINQAKDLLLS